MQSLCNVRTSNVFFHEKDTDRARLHKQSDRQKKWTYGHHTLCLQSVLLYRNKFELSANQCLQKLIFIRLVDIFNSQT